MDFPDSIIISPNQKKKLFKLWGLMSEKDKEEFINILVNEENNLKELILEFLKKDPEFLSKFKNLRRKRKMKILHKIEVQDRKKELKFIN